MAGAFQVQVFDRATPEMLAIARMLEPNNVARVVAEDVAIAIQDHLRRLNAERANSLGGERTNFYAHAAESVTHHAVDGAAVVSIGWQGIRQRFYGGTITPQDKQWLTIPARSETYGHTAREFSNLRFVLFSGQTAALVKSSGFEQTESVDAAGNVSVTPRKKRALKDEGLVMFWLVKSVTQAPDRSVLPSDEELRAVSAQSIRDYFEAGGA